MFSLDRSLATASGDAFFSAGRWCGGLPIAVIAVSVSAFLFVHRGWPRDVTRPGGVARAQGRSPATRARTTAVESSSGEC